jgi:hypothetical protein
VVKRNDCVFDLSYAAPPDQAGAGRADFRRFVAGYFRGRMSERSERDLRQPSAARGAAALMAKP